jgi:YD repeat-containing protein
LIGTRSPIHDKIQQPHFCFYYPTSPLHPDSGIERVVTTAIVKGLIAYTNQFSKPTLYDYDVVGRRVSETYANLEIIRQIVPSAKSCNPWLNDDGSTPPRIDRGLRG